VTEPDFDRLYARMKELLDTVEAEYPKVQVMMQIGSFDRYDSIYRNSNGTEFRKQGGYYEYELEFSAHDGDQTTGIDFCYAVMADLETPLIELGQARRHLEDVQNSLNPTPLTGKFTGTMILTPQCLENFISMTIGNYVSGGVILEGTSLWLDKIGEQVADERITVKADPFDERIVLGERNTGDGFRTEPVTIIEKGVLKSHILSLYVSNKTGRPVTKNGCGDLVMDLGEGTLEDLVKDVEKGLIVGGFSGGQPGINGEFSGVAKNSFLVENGKIVGAVSETMINGNLGEMLQHVRGLSRETGNNGTSVFPYMAVDGIVISGK
jgi:PmbA protein